MFDPKLKSGMAAFLALSGIFGGNLFFMQDIHRENGPDRVAFPGTARYIAKPPVQARRIAPPAEAAPIVDDETDVAEADQAAEPTLVKAEPTAGWATSTKTGSLAPILPDADLTRATQRELQVLGYEAGGVDGVAGLTTRAAIMAFEWDHGLPLNAEPKQDVLQSLLIGGQRNGGKAGAAASQPIGPLAKDVIKTVQKHLKGLGHSKLKPSGVLDEGTRGAIRRFEAKEGLQQTGRISGRMTARLLQLSAAKPAPSAKTPAKPEKRVAKGQPAA